MLEFDPKYVKLAATSLALFASLGLAFWLVLRIRSRYRDNEDPAAAEQLMLMQLRDLRRQGDLSENEYRSIKGRLVERLDGLPKTEDTATPLMKDRQELPKA